MELAILIFRISIAGLFGLGSIASLVAAYQMATDKYDLGLMIGIFYVPFFLLLSLFCIGGSVFMVVMT